MSSYRPLLMICVGLLLWIQGCYLPSPSGTLRISSPSHLLKEIRQDAPDFSYRGFFIKGSLYYFSTKRNFRGFFVIKGNRNYPWIIEVHWSMGNLVCLGRVRREGCELYLAYENLIYQSHNLIPLFGMLGLSPSISPSLWLKLLTGEWKKTIPSPVKVLSLPRRGYRLVFKGYFVSCMDVYLNDDGTIDEIVLRFPSYKGYIKISSCRSMEFVSPGGEKSILKIKEISLQASPLKDEELRVFFPPKAKKLWIYGKK